MNYDITLLCKLRALFTVSFMYCQGRGPFHRTHHPHFARPCWTDGRTKPTFGGNRAACLYLLHAPTPPPPRRPHARPPRPSVEPQSPTRTRLTDPATATTVRRTDELICEKCPSFFLPLPKLSTQRLVVRSEVDRRRAPIEKDTLSLERAPERTRAGSCEIGANFLPDVCGRQTIGE